ncbi:MAG: tryptophan-rich sensory protein [Candidatus Nealsonbacteria bacterium]|nr:tryptophan-rich sensory protein [Candidatus Nealsonbacteria bacterium]
MTIRNFPQLIFSIIIAQLAGVIGSIFTAASIQNWYVFLEKPFFAPPNWLFAPAWITLYALMGISAFLVWQKKENLKLRNYALKLYAIHLVLNALWSVIFFGLRNPGLAFIEIVVLWIFILIITVKFFKIRKSAGFLFIPYLLWVSFASVLNLFIWLLNL